MANISLTRSTLSGIDVRAKLAWIIALFFIVFLFEESAVQFAAIGALGIIGLVGVISKKLQAKPLLAALKVLISMLVIVVLLQAFIYSGRTILFSFPIFSWTARFTLEGLIYGLAMASRFITISLAFVMFFMTTSAYNLSVGLYKLGIPYKFAYLVPMALDRFPGMVTLTQTIQYAQAVRGFGIEMGSIMQKIKNFMPILIPLVVLSMREAGYMAIALELRGFGRKEKIVFLFDQELKWFDRLLLLGAGLFLVIVIGIKIGLVLGIV